VWCVPAAPAAAHNNGAVLQHRPAPVGGAAARRCCQLRKRHDSDLVPLLVNACIEPAREGRELPEQITSTLHRVSV